MRDGIPIALGYFAVAFTLGIAARNAGMNAWQGFSLKWYAEMLKEAGCAEAGVSPLLLPKYARHER